MSSRERLISWTRLNNYVCTKLGAKRIGSYQYHQYVEREIEKQIEICGFLSTSDLSNPPILSRHLLLPVSEGKRIDLKINHLYT